MASPQYIQVPADSAGKRVDGISVDVGGTTVFRQSMILTGSGSAEYVQVVGGSASTSAIGVVVRPTTATVVVSTGQVSLGAGSSIIGSLDGISATVQVAIGTPFILQGISTTVQVAIGTPFTIQGISTTVNTIAVIGAISAGVSIGINSISATVTVRGVVDLGNTPAEMSASRGPKCVTASTSGNVTLIASPGAGANIFITELGAHNASGSFISLRVGTSASIQTIVVPAASSGGGAVYKFDPPWMLSASEAALCSVKPNAAYGVFNVQFYVR